MNSKEITPKSLWDAYQKISPGEKAAIDAMLFPKKLLSSNDLIAHMKRKGIRFELVDESSALHFLEEHNYYFKLASYRKNYNKAPVGPSCGKYIDLDFAYLKDLSTIDFHIRYLIIHMCLDIEHSLRTLLLQDIAANPKEDGYHIVSDWDNSMSHRNKISRHLNTSYAKGIIKKYSLNYPVWALLELLSFGELCDFVKFYNIQYPSRFDFDVKLLFPVRDIRNAAAHNNCLIHNVRENSSINVNGKLRNFVIRSFNHKNNRLINRNLNNKPIHDFAALLFLYPSIVKSEDLRSSRKSELYELLFTRIPRNRSYYRKNSALRGTYRFILRVLKNVCFRY